MLHKSKNNPIGMFDSGFGGLTVLRAVADIAPNENYVYFGDSARYPYGPKSSQEIVEYSLEIASYLTINFDIKLLVIACNTASAHALAKINKEFDIPVVGVIGPGVKAAINASEGKRVGVIGTVGTIRSGAYQNEFENYVELSNVTFAACPGFVEFVERGDLHSEQLYVLAERLLNPIKTSKVSTLLLACTHYPFLARVISDVVGRDVVLVSSADETAFEIYDLLRTLNLENEGRGGRRIYLCSGSAHEFKRLGQTLFGQNMEEVEKVSLSKLRLAYREFFKEK